MTKRAVTLTAFKGIAPKFSPHLPPGMAEVAQNCDLANGKLAPLKADWMVKADTSRADSLVKFGRTWRALSGAHYSEATVDRLDMLFWLNAGVPWKEVGGVQALLGQTPPAAPICAIRNQATVINLQSAYAWRLSASGEHEYYCVLALTDGDPALTEPNAVECDGTDYTAGTLGSLKPGEWSWGDNDTLGFDTIYIRFAASSEGERSGDLSKYNWTLSSVGTDNYYATHGGFALPYVPEVWEVFQGDEALATELLPGSGLATEGVWAWGDNDSLGFSTLYVRLWGGANPENWRGGIHAVTELADKEVLAKYDGEGVDGTVRYCVTLTRDVGGHIDESGPSAITPEIVVKKGAVTVNRPVNAVAANVTHWNIYRVSTATGEYLLVASVDIATATYDDTTLDADLGVALPTEYTSSQGNLITFGPPGETFDGLMEGMHAGMCFAWKGESIRWTEPGKPDAWPAFYEMGFPSRVKKVLTFAGAVVVITMREAFRIEGTNAELLTPVQMVGNEPCIGTAACATPLGIVFLCDSGLALNNLSESKPFTDDRFTEAWFKANVNPVGAHLIENDRVLYLFHDTGALVYDGRDAAAPEFTTLDLVAYASWKDVSTGKLYILDADGIHELGAETTGKALTWKSGDLLGDTPTEKHFEQVTLRGTGAITLTAYVDGIEVASKAMDFATERGSRLLFPPSCVGRALAVELTGTGTITELAAVYS